TAAIPLHSQSRYGAPMLSPADHRRGPWRAEARAMLLLAWPLVLTNVAQQLINATDVVLLGWAGASTLAAAALGMNLYVGFLVLSIGLVQASAPIMAKAIGARASNIRDVRSTVRQTMWAV